MGKGQAAGSRVPLFFPFALIIAGAMTSVAAVAAFATEQVVLLTSAAALAFSAGGYLFGTRGALRVAVKLAAHLSGARAVQTRLREDGIAKKREWAGLIAELAEAQAEAMELAERNSNLLAQLAHRPPPTSVEQAVERPRRSSHKSLKS
jgi:hypothetical protein